MTIVETTRPITGGVDTHLDVHVAAAVDANGGVLGVESFPTTTAGFAELHDWLAGFGAVDRVGVEGTGAYGAGLARYLRGRGRGGDRGRSPEPPGAPPQRQVRQLDAIEAARAALSGRASGIAKSADGDVEAIRALLVARRSGRNVRIKYLNQIRHLGFTAPTSCGNGSETCPATSSARTAAALRPDRGQRHRSLYATKLAIATLGRRVARARRRRRTTSTRVLDDARAPHRARACSRSTASASTPPRSCWSPPATTRTRSAAKPRSRTCAASRPSARRRARPTGTDSTPAGTAKRTMRCGGSCSPA